MSDSFSFSRSNGRDIGGRQSRYGLEPRPRYHQDDPGVCCYDAFFEGSFEAGDGGRRFGTGEDSFRPRHQRRRLQGILSAHRDCRAAGFANQFEDRLVTGWLGRFKTARQNLQVRPQLCVVGVFPKGPDDRRAAFELGSDQLLIYRYTSLNSARGQVISGLRVSGCGSRRLCPLAGEFKHATHIIIGVVKVEGHAQHPLTDGKPDPVLCQMPV